MTNLTMPIFVQMFCSRLIVVLVVAVGGVGVFVASSADAATWGDFDDIVQKYAQ